LDIILKKIGNIGLAQSYRGSYCKMCKRETKNNAIFCSKICEELHYDYVSISIPRSWVIRTLSNMTCTNIKNEATRFSDRNKLSRNLVMLKLQRKYGVVFCKEIKVEF